MRKEYYVDDKSYCDGSRNEERRLRQLTDDMIIKPGYKPTIDSVMCVKTAKFHPSEQHPTCAAVWGDPRKFDLNENMSERMEGTYLKLRARCPFHRHYHV